MSSFTEGEQEEIKLLHDLFSDLELIIIEHVYRQHDKDYKATQEALAELANHPSKQEAMLATIQQGATHPAMQPAQVRLMGQGSTDAPGPSGNLIGALALSSAGEEPEPSPSYLQRAASGGFADQEPDRQGSGNAWEFTSLADTLVNVGGGLTEGITSLATHITGWVADLASAFDAGWGEDEDEEGASHPHPRYDKDAPAVGIGGALGLERPYQRRGGGAQAGSSGGALPASSMPRDELAEEEEEYDAGDDDEFKKDD
uniref:CUE domain-containing protein n=1 Tax=Chlamydomonas leiostraca TaxID=1034604 RepID=A0A7S0WR25_9CHLO|eukprot:CAMPEP_0202860354 /NCGR_PEP_ID=MMETSP1391-20130828/2093_1 /ASSEMBLY_ACC=CAM_ASM_000867 /TAXON_ID=1034604 /ORGANISM="Chlamydomonas leiostraca, Strain SAG 11-49" /LENGTH=257 /DNA_ID=CAMNT_0049539509 /DNA_START=89 /DNA_END=862 /DNA_ORIENTATION=+